MVATAASKKKKSLVQREASAGATREESSGAKEEKELPRPATSTAIKKMEPALEASAVPVVVDWGDDL